MIRDTLYAKYMKERQNAEILENENGFIVYGIGGEECFLMEIYIEPSSRGGPTLKRLMDTLSDIAMECGCKSISATIHVVDPHATKTIASAIKIGFEIKVAQNGIIIIAKNLKGSS